MSILFVSCLSGRGAAWLARLLWEQEVVSSNLTVPTIFSSFHPQMTSEEVIQALQLERHPEGGWYRRAYESEELVQLPRGERSTNTSILYLLQEGEHSAWHSLVSEERWFFHDGGGVRLHLFGPGGYEEHRLGVKLEKGETPQVTIPPGVTFGAELTDPVQWCLVGCTVCPGFDFADFSWGNAEDMERSYPGQAGLIRRLARRFPF